MVLSIKSPKDFWMAVVYFAIGGFGLVIGRDYAIGSTVNMGPGYFPFYISCLLVMFGVISAARSMIVSGEPVGTIAWKAMALIVLPVVAFGFLLERAGLLIALPLLLLITAAASQHFRFDRRALAGLTAFTVACAGLFNYGLRLPIPLLGSWFG